MSLIQDSSAFINHLDDFVRNLKPVSWSEVVTDPDRSAILSADLVNGFCYEGNLASPRVAALVAPVVKLFEQAHARGVRQFVLVQEWHHEQAEEFHAFARHCVRGTSEAQTVKELASLPFAESFKIVHKNSLHPAIDTDFDQWLDAHAVDTAIVVGDCTDLCTDNLAMHLRLRANARNQRMRVIVPANAVDTYDLPIETARQIGAMPHDGNFLHAVFLYHMALNAIEVVKAIEA